jgi:prepilin-type N-terminal cleavage/methylation domain-containing protein
MKRGFTLIELLVYMAIMGFIIVVAGRVFSDSTSMRVRSQNMIKAAEEVGKVANIISEDISQMGAKFKGNFLTGSNYSISNVNDNLPVSNKVYMDVTNQTNPDSSSFSLWKNHDNKEGFDRLVFRKAEFNEEGEFLGVREISWYADGNKLYRSCKTIYENKSNSDNDAICPKDKSQEVQIASNIKRFSLFPSAPGTAPKNPISSPGEIPKDTLFPPEGQLNDFKLIARQAGDAQTVGVEHNHNSNGTVAEITTFAKNDAAGEKKHNEVYFVQHGDNIADCMEVPIKKGETYAVEFDMPYFESTDGPNDSLSSQFLPGKDHIAVGLRASNGADLTQIVSSDVLLYSMQYQFNKKAPPNKPRYAEFTANNDIPSGKACVALTFSFYSPKAYEGKLRFENFKIYRKQTGTYHFVKESNKYVKDLENTYATEEDDQSRKLAHKRKVKAFELILEIEQNGEVAGTYSRELSGMAIPVPNNGATSL